LAKDIVAGASPEAARERWRRATEQRPPSAIA
jgi:hypothetical protein